MKRVCSILLCTLLAVLCLCLVSCGHEHTWDDGKITTPAACGDETVEGVKTFTCTGCKQTKTETFVSTEEKHSMGDWIVMSEPTCEEAGVRVRSCIYCGWNKEGEIANLGGHQYDDGELKGKRKYYTCTVCGATMNINAYVTYEEFGAKGDGVTDDFEAIYATHEYANKWGVTVLGTEGATYYIGKINKTATIKTNVDWKGCIFIIDDTKVSYTKTFADGTNERSYNIFYIAPENNSYKVSVPKNMTLTAGQTNLGMTFDTDVMLLIENNTQKNFIRFGINASSGNPVKEYILVDKNGNVSEETPIQYDYPVVTSITAYSVTDTPITVKNGTFQTIACDPVAENPNYVGAYYYYARGLNIARSNTVLEGIEHYISDHMWDEKSSAYNTGAPYAGFYSFNSCANVTIKDSIATGHREYKFYQGSATNAMGSYDVNGTGAVNLSFINFKQSNSITDKANQHGLFGTNYCRNVLLEDCYIDRFDAHSALYNVTIKNSTIGFGIYLIGGGTAYIENVTRTSENQFVYLRDDYGAVWFGDIIIKDCRFEAPEPKFIIRGFWRSFDFGYECEMGRNIVVDNLVAVNGQGKEVALAAYIITKPEAADQNKNPLTDSVNPLIVPKSLTFKNMKKPTLADSSTAAFINVNSIGSDNITYENCN